MSLQRNQAPIDVELFKALERDLKLSLVCPLLFVYLL